VPTPTLTTVDGISLHGRRWLAAAPCAAVVLVHGFSASSSCPNVVELASALHEMDLDVVSYDARGHGASLGESTLGDDEQHDVAAAVAQARERTDRVVLVGASMGAIAALRYAVTDPGLVGVVSVSCPAAWRLPRTWRGGLAALMTRTRTGRLLMHRLAGVRVAGKWTNPAPPIDLVGLLDVPVTFVHGADDRFIAADDARQLFDRAPEPRRLVVVPEMGHAFGPAAVVSVTEAVGWSLGQHAKAAS
jgi:alpha-beta hydrolase superfamily lysophospholipase